MKKENLVEKEKNRQDLGFGTNVTDRSARLIKSDGRFNIKRKGQSFYAWLNAYNRLITMSWSKFIILTGAFYTILNFAFALIYLGLGVDNQHFIGIDMSTNLTQFWDSFFFSAQTLTTVGYGRIAPISFSTSLIASLESLLGLMIFALITGLLYGRFSRPNPRIIYSKNIIIAPYLDTRGLMFRMVNERSNQLIKVEVSVIFTKIEERDGHSSRRYYGLPLERNKVDFFPTNWTIVHAITEDSPLFLETPESLKAADAEFLISVQGTDDTFTDTIHSRKSYQYQELVCGAKFRGMLESDGSEAYLLDLTKIDDFDLVELK